MAAVALSPRYIERPVPTWTYMRLADGSWIADDLSAPSINVDSRTEALKFFTKEDAAEYMAAFHGGLSYALIEIRENLTVLRIRHRVKDLLASMRAAEEQIRSGNSLAKLEWEEARKAVETHRPYLLQNQLADEYLIDQRDEWNHREADKLSTQEAFALLWPNLTYEDCAPYLHEFTAIQMDNHNREAALAELRESVA